MKIKYTGVQFVYSLDEAKVIHWALDKYTDELVINDETDGFWSKLAFELKEKTKEELDKHNGSTA